MSLNLEEERRADDHRGEIIDSRYEAYDYLGKGATAVVYLSKDLKEDKMVAIKILRSRRMGDPRYIERFSNEAQAIGLVEHDRIVKIEKVKLDTEIPYIVSEYINGPNITGYIDYKKSIDLEYKIKYMKQTLEGISYLHNQGIIHKDIRPQNILLADRDNVKILDLGISDFPGNEKKSPFYRDMGAAHYLSPELINGDDYDKRTDIYSMGIMFYQFLAQKLPFDSHRSIIISLMHRKKVPKPIREINPDVPEELERIALKAIEKNPDDRYQSADDMLKDIKNYEDSVQKH